MVLVLTSWFQCQFFSRFPRTSGFRILKKWEFSFGFQFWVGRRGVILYRFVPDWSSQTVVKGHQLTIRPQKMAYSISGKFSMPSDRIRYSKFRLPGIFSAIPWARPGYQKIPGYLTFLPTVITWKTALSGTWPPQEVGCITYSKVQLSQIFIGNSMALHMRKLQVHSDFATMPSYWARW